MKINKQDIFRAARKDHLDDLDSIRYPHELTHLDDLILIKICSRMKWSASKRYNENLNL